MHYANCVGLACGNVVSNQTVSLFILTLAPSIFAGINKVSVSKYSRNDIRFVFNAFNAHSKYEIAKVITDNVKQLPVELPKKRLSHKPEHYSMTIFDAISLAITHYYQT